MAGMNDNQKKHAGIRVSNLPVPSVVVGNQILNLSDIIDVGVPWDLIPEMKVNPTMLQSRKCDSFRQVACPQHDREIYV